MNKIEIEGIEHVLWNDNNFIYSFISREKTHTQPKKNWKIKIKIKPMQDHAIVMGSYRQYSCRPLAWYLGCQYSISQTSLLKTFFF